MAFLTMGVGLLADADAVAAGPLAGAKVGLFISSHTPAIDDTESDYAAIEAAWTGYARQTVASWTAAALDGSDRAVLLSSVLSFTVTGSPGGAEVVGYFVLKADDTIHHAEELAAPLPVVADVPFELVIRYRVQNLP